VSAGQIDALLVTLTSSRRLCKELIAFLHEAAEEPDMPEDAQISAEALVKDLGI
jgi:hypothetical protein